MTGHETVTQAGGESPSDVGPSETTVLVVDDHRSFADLLSASLEFLDGIRCIGTAPSAEAGLPMVAALRPSVVVMDLEMPGMGGLLATRQIREASPSTAVAVVTAHLSPEWIALAERAGASAFIPKGGPFLELVDLLRAARPGTMLLPPSLTPDSTTARADRSGSGLTDRELEALGLMCEGLTDKTIASRMGISVHTLRGYLKAVYAALHVRSRIDAVNRALQLKLVDPGRRGGQSRWRRSLDPSAVEGSPAPRVAGTPTR